MADAFPGCATANIAAAIVSKNEESHLATVARGTKGDADPVVLLREARSQTDAGLLAECQQGDTTAFDEIVRRYKDRVYNVVYRFVGNREDALDIAQDVFIRAYRSVDGFRGAAQVYTWLYSIAVNLAKNRLRDRTRKGRDRGVSLDAAPDPDGAPPPQHAVSADTPRTQAMDHELEETLQRCLDELPEHYRLTFVLRIYEDMSYEEIAETMGCPVGTVKSRLNQARAMLRDRLKALSLV